MINFAMYLSTLAIRRHVRRRTTRRRRRSKKETSSVDRLPRELIELILSKCPVKSVLRFKSVSKSWQSIISDPRFSRIHHIERSKLPENQNKFLFHADHAESEYEAEDFRLSLIGLRDGKWRREAWSGARISRWPVCSCDGLILLQQLGSGEYVLWNPFIRKHIITSPKPSKACTRWNYGDDHLYYDSASEDYKIVFVNIDWYTVYSCKSGSWGETKDFPRDRILCSSTIVDGCVYHMQRSEHEIILCFDVRDGKLDEVPQPKGVECLVHVQLEAVSERLCLYGFTEDGGGLQLWVMERNNEDYDYCRSWRKLISMDNRGSLSYILHQTCPICLSNEDDVVLWSNGEQFIYNARRKSLQEANFTWKISHLYCPYQENLYLL